MDLTVCIPTLNAYKELQECINSLNNSSVLANILVLDNGGTLQLAEQNNLTIIRPERNLGVAGSWNYFINNVDGLRLISNDDVIFQENSIEKLLEDYDENFLLCPTGMDTQLNAFSCFILPQKIIDVVGLFDEKISPQYGYFEDNDYHRRMKFLGFDLKLSSSKVFHKQSSTIKNFTTSQQKSHHDKFRKAKTNYIMKWGGPPGLEVLTTPREL